MPQAVIPLLALLTGAAILLAGNGLQGILLPVRASIEGFSLGTIGLIAAAYSAGFVVGCVTMPRMIMRVGHIRSFAALAALASSVVMMMAMEVHAVLWIGLRAVSGLCFAGLYMVIESWLNQQSTNADRGQMFSIYLLVNTGAVTLGQMLLPLGDPARFELFIVTAMAITLALVPVSLTRYAGPPPPETAQLRLRRLYDISPVGVLGCFFVGLSNGAFGGLGAVFAAEIGLSVTGVAVFMSAAYLGGAVAQLPLGRLSDRIDRRRVIVLSCAIAATSGLLLMIVGDAKTDDSWSTLAPWLRELSTLGVIAIVAVYGSSIYPLYGLCIAHANDFVPREDFVEASSGLLLTWGIGAMIGPLLAPVLMQSLGLGGLFAYTAVLHLAFAGIVILRMRRRAARPPEERPDFVHTGNARLSPAAAVLDPRAAEEERQDLAA